jgi:outer membrane protein
MGFRSILRPKDAVLSCGLHLKLDWSKQRSMNVISRLHLTRRRGRNRPRITADWLKGACMFCIWLATWPGLGTVWAAPRWTLEQAIKHALTNSPDTRLAGLRIQSARAALQEAQSSFWPRLHFQSGYTRTDNPIGVFGAALNQRSYSSTLDFNDVPDADNLNVKGLVTVPLYAGGRNVAEKKAAQAASEATREEEAAVGNQLQFEVARAFHSATKAREFIRAAEAAVQSFQTNLVIARKRLAGGTLLKAEMLDLEVRLSAAEEELVRARHGQALSLRALGNLLGLEGETVEIAEDVATPPVPVSNDFSKRPELAAFEHRRREAGARVREAKGGYLPRVEAFGSLDYDYGWEFGGSGRSYTAGLLLHWDLWDGYQTRARIREAESRQSMVGEEERRIRLAIGLETEQARQHFEEAQESLKVTERAILLAEESVKLTRARFEEGLALGTQLIDAETALTAARVRRAQAEADRLIAIAALRKALGLPQIKTEEGIK